MSSDIRKPSRVVSTNGALSSSRRRERRAVHEEIEPAELTVDAPRTPRRSGCRLVTSQGSSSGSCEAGRELADVLFETLALIRDREPGAGCGSGLRDRPGDRSLVGDADDESGLTGERHADWQVRFESDRDQRERLRPPPPPVRQLDHGAGAWPARKPPPGGRPAAPRALIAGACTRRTGCRLREAGWTAGPVPGHGRRAGDRADRRRELPWKLAPRPFDWRMVKSVRLPLFLVPFDPWKRGAYQRSMHRTVFDDVRRVSHLVFRLTGPWTCSTCSTPSDVLAIVV